MGVAPDVATLAAKQAITEVLNRYCRAMDRMDRDLAIDCYHPDGVDQHSNLFTGSREGWAAWVEQFHSPMTVTRHVLSNVIIELDGDDAWVESYWTLLLRVLRDGRLYDVSLGGRYLDLFRSVAGVWAIQHRRTTNDWGRVDEVTATVGDTDGRPLVEINDSLPGFAARRDRRDPSYDFLQGHRTDFDSSSVTNTIIS